MRYQKIRRFGGKFFSDVIAYILPLGRHVRVIEGIVCELQGLQCSLHSILYDVLQGAADYKSSKFDIKALVLEQ